MLIVQNTSGSGPGQLPTWIEQAGAVPRVLRAFDDVAVPTDPGDAVAVILLGGGLMPDADLDHPWLPAERELIRSCRARAVPLLGICLGGQLIAHTFGGAVRAKQLDRAEAGVVALNLRPEAADDLLFRELPSPVPAMEHHEDAIVDLPPDAVWLASTEVCPIQAFRLDSLWALQFHPEAPGSRVATWNREELAGQGYDPDALVAAAQQASDELERVWSRFITRLLGISAA